MKYFRSRFYSALQLLEQYQYPEPFHLAAKTFFKQNKKYGSKDRKAIASICYSYLRAGRTFDGITLKESLLLACVFVELEDESVWNALAEELGFSHRLPSSFLSSGNISTFIEEAIGQKIQFYPSELLEEKYLHYNDSANIRFRPKNWAKDHTDDEPRNIGIVGVRELVINQQLEATLQVQDLSSQYICGQIAIEEGDKVWDVCSGAGGKSLNLASRGVGELYLSDIRPQIIETAKNRFRSMHYDAHFGVTDLSKSQKSLSFATETITSPIFDKIIADVPCSGSGTWFSTPEHFMHIDYSKLDSYVARQKAIVLNALPFLKPDGKFYYITCSVFAKENSEVKDWIVENTDLILQDEIFFDGMRHKADGMYMASFEW